MNNLKLESISEVKIEKVQSDNYLTKTKKEQKKNLKNNLNCM